MPIKRKNGPKNENDDSRCIFPTFIGGDFHDFCMVISPFGKMIPILTCAYFSDGLVKNHQLEKCVFFFAIDDHWCCEKMFM